MRRGRVLVAYLVVGALLPQGCGGKKAPEVNEVMVTVPLETALRAADLRAGMDKSSVFKLIGKPSAERALVRKETGKSFGFELKYYVYKADPGLVNEKTDRGLSLYFDESGRLSHAFTNIPELHLNEGLKR